MFHSSGFKVGISADGSQLIAATSREGATCKRCHVLFSNDYGSTFHAYPNGTCGNKAPSNTILLTEDCEYLEGGPPSKTPYSPYFGASYIEFDDDDTDHYHAVAPYVDIPTGACVRTRSRAGDPGLHTDDYHAVAAYVDVLV